MPTIQLTIGPVHTLLQNIVYALPARSWKGFTSSAGAVFQGSNILAFTDSDTITIGTDGDFTSAATFIRATNAAGADVRLQAL